MLPPTMPPPNPLPSLHNPQVIDGLSERGGHPVVRMPMKQWMLRITAYADRLLHDLDNVDWADSIKGGGGGGGGELTAGGQSHEGMTAVATAAVGAMVL